MMHDDECHVINKRFSIEWDSRGQCLGCDRQALYQGRQ